MKNGRPKARRDKGNYKGYEFSHTRLDVVLRDMADFVEAADEWPADVTLEYTEHKEGDQFWFGTVYMQEEGDTP